MKRAGEVFYSSCTICQTRISVFDYECGHIHSRATGGKDELDNLDLICSDCNKSVGKKHMTAFKEAYKLPTREPVKEETIDDQMKRIEKMFSEFRK